MDQLIDDDLPDPGADGPGGRSRRCQRQGKAFLYVPHQVRRRRHFEWYQVSPPFPCLRVLSGLPARRKAARRSA